MGARDLATEWLKQNAEALKALDIEPSSLSLSLTPHEYAYPEAQEWAPSVKGVGSISRFEVFRKYGEDEEEGIDFDADAVQELWEQVRYTPELPTNAKAKTDKLLKLMDPVDAELLHRLADGVITQKQLAKELGITQGAVSHNLASAMERVRRIRILSDVLDSDQMLDYWVADRYIAPDHRTSYKWCTSSPKHLLQLYLSFRGIGSRIAEHLGVGQASVSMQLKELRKYLPQTPEVQEAYNPKHSLGRYDWGTEDSRCPWSKRKGTNNPNLNKGPRSPKAISPLLRGKHRALFNRQKSKAQEERAHLKAARIAARGIK